MSKVFKRITIWRGQQALAQATGIQPAHMSAMERGKRPIGKVVAQHLTKALEGDWRALASP